jgi:hypothetical protein
MIDQQTRRTRTASQERWQRALQRALFAGVGAKQLAGSGEWVVASASLPGVAYRTDGVSCDCEAAMLGGDPVCLHRAAYWYAIGVLELDAEPDPPALGAGADCPDCNGCGVHYSRELERRGLLYPTCRVCDGTGSITVPAVRPAA